MIPGFLRIKRLHTHSSDWSRLVFGPIISAQNFPASYSSHLLKEAFQRHEEKEFSRIYIESLEVVDNEFKGDAAEYGQRFFSRFGLKGDGVEEYPERLENGFSIARHSDAVTILHDYSNMNDRRKAVKKVIYATDFRRFSKQELSMLLPASEKLNVLRALGGVTYYKVEDELEA